jgi:archaemetzincin
VTISILPILNVSEATIRDIAKALGNVFLSKVEVRPTLNKLPDNTYVKDREQYDAQKLLHFLDKEYHPSQKHKLLAACNVDIFAGEMNFIYGVAQMGGGLSLISLYRLDQRYYSKPSDYEKLFARAVKEATHELGHSYHLEHCDNKGCVMQFSDDIMAVDQKESWFCEDCRERLKRRL